MFDFDGFWIGSYSQFFPSCLAPSAVSALFLKSFLFSQAPLSAMVFSHWLSLSLLQEMGCSFLQAKQGSGFVITLSHSSPVQSRGVFAPSLGPEK